MEGDWIAFVDWTAPTSAGAPQMILQRGTSGTADAEQTSAHGWEAVLAGTLELPGGTPGTVQDLLAGFRTQGVEGLRGLRGRFAALLWHGVERRLFALRDPMGVYPLFYCRLRGKMLLSPSIERLVEADGSAGEIDRVAVAGHLWHRWRDKQRTYFESVRRVTAGHVLDATETGTALTRYWDPGSQRETGRVDWLAPSELDRFDALFDQAIRRCAGSGRTGIFLSGGLDSVSIAARLAEQRPEPPPLALSLAFDHPACDELAIQRAVAVSLGLEQEIQAVPGENGLPGPLESAACLADSWPHPPMNVWNGEFFRLARTGRRRGCEVIVTGSGGDDWLGVSPYYAADLLLAARVPTLVRLVGSLRASHGMTAREATRVAVWTFGLRALVRGFLRRMSRGLALGGHWRTARRPPEWLAPDSDLRRRLVESPDREPAEDLSGAGFYVREMRRGLDHPLVALELEESFEMGRRLDLRIGHPFLDSDLVEYLYRVPPSVLIGSGGPDRALVRDRLAQRFPEVGFEGLRKSDARPFFARLARTEGERVWRELGGPRELERLGIVDGRGVEAEVEKMLCVQGPTAGTFRLWDLINLERWLRSRVGRHGE